MIGGPVIRLVTGEVAQVPYRVRCRDMSPTYPRFGLRVVRVSAVSVATVPRDGPITYLLTYCESRIE